MHELQDLGALIFRQLLTYPRVDAAPESDVPDRYLFRSTIVYVTFRLWTTNKKASISSLPSTDIQMNTAQCRSSEVQELEVLHHKLVQALPEALRAFPRYFLAE